MLLATGILLFGGVAQAGIAQVHRVDRSAQRMKSQRKTTEAARMLMRGDYGSALVYADEAIQRDPTDGWAFYDRAAALAGLGRTDEAVAAYHQAEERFTDDAYGTSVAIYGRARALASAGRCDEASPVYRDYATYVAPADARASAMARRYGAGCVSPSAPVAATPRAPSDRQPVRGRGGAIERQPAAGRDWQRH